MVLVKYLCSKLLTSKPTYSSSKPDAYIIAESVFCLEKTTVCILPKKFLKGSFLNMDLKIDCHSNQYVSKKQKIASSRLLFSLTVISYRSQPVKADPGIRALTIKVRIRARVSILMQVVLATKFKILTPLIFQD